MLPRILTLFGLSLIYLLPLPSAAAKASDKKQLELFYGMAEGNYRIGDLQGASHGIKEVLRLDPEYLPAISLKARVELDKGNPEAALTIAEEAIQIAPETLEYQLLKALILGNLNRRNEALGIIDQVIASAPNKSDDFRAANQLLGLLKMASGEWDAAARAFNEIYLAQPQTAQSSLKLASEAYLEKARAALEAKKPDSAIASINDALQLYANTTGEESLRQRYRLRMIRAQTLARMGRIHEAIEDLQYITGQQPDNIEASVTLASLYASSNRWSSLEALIPLIASRPDLADIALYFEGRSALARNRVGTARIKFEEALDLLKEASGPLSPALRFYRGLCLEKLDRPTEANAEILTALTNGFQPETTSEAEIAGRILLQDGQYNKAIQLLERVALTQEDTTAELWTLLARNHQANDHATLALSAYNQAILKAPRNANLRGLRATLLRQLGDLEGAEADYQSGLLLDPSNGAFTYALGIVQFQQGKLIAASQNLGLAAKLHPENPGMQLLHAILAYTVGAPKTARKALDEYLRLNEEKPNESALYLEYVLMASTEPGLAILDLNYRTLHPESSEALKQFILYCVGKIDRKSILDHAGIAKDKLTAQRQICEAAFWTAQHEYQKGNFETAKELLELATQVGNPDIAEYQLAQWQLISRAS